MKADEGFLTENWDEESDGTEHSEEEEEQEEQEEEEFQPIQLSLNLQLPPEDKDPVDPAFESKIEEEEGKESKDVYIGEIRADEDWLDTDWD